MVGVKVRFNTQPLPVLRDLQPNMAGSDQPIGRTSPEAAERANPVTVRPSLEVKVTGMVLLVPTSTEITGLGGVATTPSCVPFTLLASLVKPPAAELEPLTLAPLLVLAAAVVLPYCDV
jgi:hypothetical protein